MVNPVELEQHSHKPSSNKIKKTLFLMTPIVFIVVLAISLLTLFNFDYRGSLLSVAQKIPIVKRWVPGTEPLVKKEDSDKQQIKTALATITKMKQMIAQKDEHLRMEVAASTKKDEKIQELEQQMVSLQETSQQEQMLNEQYEQQIKTLAQMYEKMMPSKAAPIMEQWTTDELVLILQAMKIDARIKILEKMNPKIAADVSIKLKDVIHSDDAKIAALQSRLEKQENTSAKKTVELDTEQIGKTFAAMPTKSAATLLIQTAKVNEKKTLQILQSMDNTSRSKILAEMADQSAEMAAQLLLRLTS